MRRSTKPVGGTLRGVALALLAIMLLVRLGPFCDAAMASPVATSAMASCAGDMTDSPVKKSPLSACATPCTAVRGDVLARVEPMRVLLMVFWPSSPSGMTGLPLPPAIPPPRSV